MSRAYTELPERILAMNTEAKIQYLAGRVNMLERAFCALAIATAHEGPYEREDIGRRLDEAMREYINDFVPADSA